MATLVYALNQSLDGYVDHMKFAPDPVLFRHFIADVGGLAGCIYGGRMYEIMRYWDDEQADWGEDEREYAAAWRSRPKWVASRTLETVGPNAQLLGPDIVGEIGALKEARDGVIEVSGPGLAGSLAGSGVIDEYRIYLHPVVLGSGAPFFTGPLPPMRLAETERIGEDVIRLTYRPR
ncbi:dihydrofolate reductase [Arsenicitalea aurantiaca]|uniref:Dihydrofolate reductase n=1 Tax=Arsenicitalea aurantiaca TaxID=1783274 RepID=A0A433XBD0_9HYPH|nr:dihydrofolate reductase family protein [Arsenicitalea aurantiaca]RUT31385.1 dihydrofolate reductase [Arsenicitalea aurantiaca]